jgi:hypothetical protein
VQNIHAYLHEVVGVRQQILKAFLILNVGEHHCYHGTENNKQNNFDANGNLLHLDNIANLDWYYNNTLNKLTKADKPNTTQY